MTTRSKPFAIEQLMYRNERWMYAGGRPNRLARVLNRFWAWIGASPFGRGRLVTLEVVGRRSGRSITFPLVVADYEGERYLVSMLGERASWVANVRAAGGRAVLRHGRRESVCLEEVDAEHRAPIVRRHLEVAPAARSFVSISWRASLAEFERVAPSIPVFRVRSAEA